jgi:hypothetical protein
MIKDLKQFIHNFKLTNWVCNFNLVLLFLNLLKTDYLTLTKQN